MVQLYYILLALATLPILANSNQTIDLSEQSVKKLIDYLNDRAFKELQINYRNQLKWLEATRDNRDMAIYVTMRQVEISMRNRAIKMYLADVLRRLVRQHFNHKSRINVKASLLDAMANLLIARARLRAKLMMIKANELHWLELKDDFNTFSVYYTHEQVKKLAQLTPKESLELSEELQLQSEAYKQVVELHTTRASMADILQVLDRLLDEQTGCRTCHELADDRWTQAAPLHRNFMVREWLNEYIDLEFRRVFDQERAMFVERKRLRISSLNIIKDVFNLEIMEAWRRQTLG